jgi:hypothetical protein
MLDLLRRAEVKQLVILSGSDKAIPEELGALWDDGLRTVISIVSPLPNATEQLENWRAEKAPDRSAAHVALAGAEFARVLVQDYVTLLRPDRVTLRIRDLKGETALLDITGLDDPTFPLTANYELIQERDLRPVSPSDLTASEVRDFFQNSSLSWRPFAAGLPWQHSDKPFQQLKIMLRRLDKSGPEAGGIALIRSESGAGGTTLMRSMALAAAAEGYPTLVAGDAPFTLNSTELTSFMTRVLDRRKSLSRPDGDDDRLYETPWLLVFDEMHWAGHAAELRHFQRDLERSGRPVCLMVVTGPHRGLEIANGKFSEIAALSHEISMDQALAVGRHLRPFLAPHGPIRTESEWRSFYEATAIHAEMGISAFWITLSFWVQRQFDMRETVQSWIYGLFREKIRDPELAAAIIDIAAFSTERRPLPDVMLRASKGWPISQRLEDVRKEVGALGLTRIRRDSERYWALVHDLIGRYLLTALFYDTDARNAAGLSEAQNPEHLRFLILRRLSCSPALGHASNRSIAEEFAVSIFKIDPDHGHASLVPYWKEVLEALDEMPGPLKATSRAFRHHAAISRRRIAKLSELFPLGHEERLKLLERAIADLEYALANIPEVRGGETDLSLYNSLAHAYQDLADEEASAGAPRDRIAALREKSREATQHAYRSDPDNSFVIETYARNLLADAKLTPERAIENAMRVLDIVYGAMGQDRTGDRRTHLARLADRAIDLMLDSRSTVHNLHDPTDQTAALMQAIIGLVESVERHEGMSLSDYPKANRQRAASLLAVPALAGNPQAVRLRYTLLSLDDPFNFKEQLELLQSLHLGPAALGPQLRLELALLLQQCDRHHEAERLFKELRRLWREGDYFVEVPERLRWLLTIDGRTQRQVTARVVQRNETRHLAKVRELQGTEVLFRPHEFGQQQIRPGSEIRGLISFGYNGPFLRPTTATQT